MIGAGYYEKLAKVESGNNPLAENPKSSARGRYQFISGTAKQYGLDQVDFGTPEYEQAEEQAVKKFTEDNYNYLKTKLNRDPTEGELYLAHQQGPGGAEKLLASDQNEKAINILGRDQVLNNGGNEEMTIAEFSQKWTTKFDKNSENVSVDRPMDDTSGNDDSEDMGKLPDVDAFADFGVNEGSGDIDALNDFGVDAQDEFLSQDDGTGGIKKSMIDQSSGAPSYVRQVVGTLYDPASRLATLQKYFPDAKPYGNNNFIFTHPETKKPTLYNPVGLERGDFASITKEGFVTVGSSIGAAMGAAVGVAGGPAAPATMPTGAIIGAGLGAGVSSNLFDLWMTVTGQTRDVRTFPQMAVETSAEVIGGSGGEALGRALPGALKSAVGGAKASSRAILAQLARFDIRPTSTMTSGPVAGRIEAGLSQNLGAADVMQKQADEVISQSHAALNKIVAQYGKPKTQQGAGKVIQEAAEAAVERSKETKEVLYDKAFDLVGEDTPVDPVNIKALKKDIEQRINRAPESLKKLYGPALNLINAIIADSSGAVKTTDTGLLNEAGEKITRSVTLKTPGVQFGTLKEIRTSVGRDLADPLTSGATSSQNLAMKIVYARLSEDMAAATKAAGPDAVQAMSRAEKYTKAYAETAEKTLQKILKYDAEEKAYKFALSASKDGGSSLSKLRKLFTQDEWDEVSATVLSDLGNNPASGEFSIAKFVTNYNKLAPEARAALFRGGKNQKAGDALDDFVDLMTKIKDKTRYENTSNTAGAIQVGMVLNSLGALGAGVLAGDQSGIGGWAGAAGGILAPRMAAKLITNPEFVKWLAQPVKEGTKDWAGHLARLVTIGEVNPELKESIDFLLLDMQRATAPEQPLDEQ